MEVKDQREDGLAGHIVKLDLAPAQVLSGGERVDLAAFRGPLSGGGIIVRVLDVDFSPSFAGEEVRLAAAEPDISPGPRRFRRDFIVLEAQRVQPLEALDLVGLNKEADSFFESVWMMFPERNCTF